jgi:hypothetical protein
MFMVSVFLPSYYLRAAEDLHVAGEDPVAAYERVLAFPWPQALAHEELAIALLDQNRRDEAEAHLRAAMHGLDTGRLYYLLAQTADARNEEARARDWYLLCLMRWPWHRPSWKRLEELNSPAAYARHQAWFGPWAGEPTPDPAE